jgi:UDP-N-acetylmuramoylalanine--D-glutamate ligase
LILGGYDRGIDYSGLVWFLMQSSVKNIVFLGKAGETMLKLFNEEEDVPAELHQVEKLSEALEIVKTNAERGGVCLLSPAAASYDQYHNFEHRGGAYKKLVKKMFA